MVLKINSTFVLNYIQKQLLIFNISYVSLPFQVGKALGGFLGYPFRLGEDTIERGGGRGRRPITVRVATLIVEGFPLVIIVVR